MVEQGSNQCYEPDFTQVKTHPSILSLLATAAIGQVLFCGVKCIIACSVVELDVHIRNTTEIDQLIVSFSPKTIQLVQALEGIQRDQAGVGY